MFVLENSYSNNADMYVGGKDVKMTIISFLILSYQPE